MSNTGPTVRLAMRLLAFYLVVMLTTAGCTGNADRPASPTPTATATGGLPAEQPPTPGSAVGGNVVPAPTSANAIDDGSAVALYTLAVREILRGEKANTIFLTPYIGQGEKLADPTEDKPLPGGLLDALQASDPKRTFRIGRFTEVVGSLDDGGKVKDNGILITLGEIKTGNADRDRFAVKASIYKQVGDAAGYTLRFKKNESGGYDFINSSLDWSDK